MKHAAQMGCVAAVPTPLARNALRGKGARVWGGAGGQRRGWRATQARKGSQQLGRRCSAMQLASVCSRKCRKQAHCAILWARLTAAYQSARVKVEVSTGPMGGGGGGAGGGGGEGGAGGE